MQPSVRTQVAPEPRLDQSTTITAIAAFQEYLDLFPEAHLKGQATNRLFALQDLLVEKEYKSAKLYFDLGTYFGNCTNGGNNYEACIVTAQNALKDYPYSNMQNAQAMTAKSRNRVCLRCIIISSSFFCV